MRRTKNLKPKRLSFSRKIIRFSQSHIWLSIGMFFVLFSFTAYFWHQFFLDNSKFVPSDGGIYTEATVGRIKNLNPLAPNVSLLDRDLHRLIFSGLLKYNPKTRQIEGELAEFRVGEDGKSYDLTLKNSARFSDGTPVTTDDILFTYEERIQNPNFPNRALREAFEYIRIDVIDENTVSFMLPEQNIFFPALLTTPILPKHLLENAFVEELADPELPFNKNPIGAGPFKLKNIVPEDDGSLRVFLEKNEYYVGREALLNQIVIYIYPSIEALSTKHKWPTSFSHIPFAYIEKIKKELYDEYEEYEFLLPQFSGIFFNLDKEVISNLYFRKALYLGFDTEKLIENEWQRVNGPLFFEGIETNYQSGNFIAARKILRDANFVYDKKKDILTNGEGGPPVSIKMITTINPPAYSRMAQKIAKTWEEELNLVVDLQILDQDTFLSTLNIRDYDVVLFGQNFSQNFDTLSLWHSSQSNKLNLSNITREDIDLAISEIRFSGSRSDSIAFSEKLDHLTPAIIFATPKNQLLTSQKLKGFHESFGHVRSWSDRFWKVEDWYFYQERDWDWPNNRSKIIGFIQWIFSRKEMKTTDIIPPNEENKPENTTGPTPTE